MATVAAAAGARPCGVRQAARRAVPFVRFGVDRSTVPCVWCRMKFRAAVAVAALLALTACSDPSLEDADRDESGEIAEEGDVGVLRLQLGDCVVLPDAMISAETDETVEVTDMQGVPCSETHNGEVVLIDPTYYEDYDDDWPGYTQLQTIASLEDCIAGLDAYTGTVFEESSFDVTSLVPGEQGWNALDDRELVCIGVTVDDQFAVLDTTGSIAAD